MNAEDVFRIIIIDDNPDIHKDFIKVLTTSTDRNKEIDALESEIFGDSTPNVVAKFPRFDVDCAQQGKEGFEKIKQAHEEGKPYALAFVDIRMPPGWDGIETIKHIWPIDPNIQIVICTAYSDYTWEETVTNLGLSDNLIILKKPFDNVAVRQLACALVKKWELTQNERLRADFLEIRTDFLKRSIKEKATHDYLTELPNRIMLHDKIRYAISDAVKNKSGFMVLFLDLDRFKIINDSLNHEHGDEILKLVAKRLKTMMREKDTVARIGGDEFALVISDIEDELSAQQIVKKVVSVFHNPVKVAGKDLLISASFGASLYPKDGDTTEDLIHNADLAMYSAKKVGGNQYVFYSPVMNKEVIQKFDIESELYRAIQQGEFKLYYQPQFDSKTNKIIALEALVRWLHPQKGMLMPVQFISIAEESKLILALGEWVFKEVLRQIKEWQARGIEPITIAVNISALQLKEPTFAKRIKEMIEEHNVNPEQIAIDITEHVSLNLDEVVNSVKKLKSLGMEIVLDGFGTLNSNYDLLRKLPVSRIKIDRSFIQNMMNNADDKVIVQSIIELANRLKIKVLAEGVETEEQLAILKAHPEVEIQGFYLSKPVLPSEIEKKLGHS